MSKAFPMLMQDGRQQVRIGRIALFDHLPIAGEAMFQFSIVHFVSEFRFMRLGLAPANDLGVGLKHLRATRRR